MASHENLDKLVKRFFKHAIKYDRNAFIRAENYFHERARKKEGEYATPDKTRKNEKGVVTTVCKPVGQINRNRAIGDFAGLVAKMSIWKAKKRSVKAETLNLKEVWGAIQEIRKEYGMSPSTILNDYAYRVMTYIRRESESYP